MRQDQAFQIRALKEMRKSQKTHENAQSKAECKKWKDKYENASNKVKEMTK